MTQVHLVQQQNFKTLQSSLTFTTSNRLEFPNTNKELPSISEFCYNCSLVIFILNYRAE